MTIDANIKLFKTVAELHNQGKVKLSSEERTLIESETADLIRKSKMNKGASKKTADDLLKKLKDAKGAEEIFKVVLEALEESKDDEKPEPEKADKPEKGDKPEMPFGDDKGDDEEEDEGEDEDEEEDVEDMKKEVLARAAQMEIEKEKAPKDKGPDKGPDKGKDKDLEDEEKVVKPLTDKGKDKDDGPKTKKPIKELQKDRAEKGEGKTDSEMGFEDDLMVRARKIKVNVTASKNIVATHADLGPLFHATPSAAVKSDPVALRRLVNKISGWILYDGVRKAATRCGARLVAGVDDDVVLDSQVDVKPNRAPVTEGNENDTEEKPEGEPSDVLEGTDNDTEEKQDAVTDTSKVSRRPARYSVVKKSRGRRRATDILEGAGNDTGVGQNKPKFDVTDGDDVDTEEKKEAPASDTLSGADTDMKGVEANYRRLYQARAQKAAEKGVEEFAKKLNRCIRLASRRMQLNHDENPMKAAAYDVLTAENIQFSDGSHFVPMPEHTASEIVELIGEEAQDAFVKHLVGRALDLMEKSEGYLKDAESDLKNLSPVTVSVEAKKAPKSSRSARLRREAVQGNFAMKASAPRGNSQVGDLRSALSGSTKIGRVLSRLED